MELSQAIAVTAELSGTNLSEAAAEIMATELAGYDRVQVLGALARCRRELKGRLTMAAVIERLDDGRPGPDEAWALLPLDESASAVWTDEMRQAYAPVMLLVEQNETNAARFAFRETYTRLVAQARDNRTPTRWTVTLGHDSAGRAGALLKAVDAGRITLSHASEYVPLLPAPDAGTLALVAPAVVALP